MTKQTIILISVLIYIIIKAFIYEPNSLDVKTYWIENRSLSGIKVAFLSDLNLKKHDFKRLNKIVKTTKAQSPDLILLGGDFAYGHDYSKTMNMNSVAQKLSLIMVPKYAVLGDDDWYSNSKDITNALRKNGITVLDDSSVKLRIKGKYLDVIGIHDKSSGQPNITRAMYRTKIPRIVFTHNPDVYYDIIEDVSVILAGHTHGGQIIIPFTPPLFVPSQFGSEFASGIISTTNNKMIISRGLGTSKFPGRYNCKPEIVMINFVDPGKIPTDGKKK